MNLKSRVFSILAYTIAFFGVIGGLGVLFPRLGAILFTVLWIALFSTVAIFFVLGFLVIFGLKSDVSKVLDIFLEGSLTVIDFIDFIKKIYSKFVQVLQEFILFFTPVITYLLTFFVYVALIILYKEVGKDYDVTLLTIVLSIVLVGAVGYLNTINKPNLEDTTILTKVRNVFKTKISDSFEVVLFVFFLTMDATNVFFLPKDLRIPISASVGDYDLMKRGFTVSEHLTITINLIIVAIIVEIFRNALKVVAMALNYYRNDRNESLGKSANIKLSIRKSFGDLKDDLVKFITFTTVLVGVFLLFPRLKLLAMAVASITSLALDVILPERLTTKRGNDLFSRILTKLFKL